MMCPDGGDNRPSPQRMNGPQQLLYPVFLAQPSDCVVKPGLWDLDVMAFGGRFWTMTEKEKSKLPVCFVPCECA